MDPRSRTANNAVSINKRERLPPIVLVDADNTLWDTDGVFAKAQMRLLTLVENAVGLKSPAKDRLFYVRQVDQTIAERHHLGLRYPPRLLIDAIAFSLAGSTLELSVERAWREGHRSGVARPTVDAIESEFIADISATPMLLPGVYRGLNELSHAAARIIVISEGSRKRILQTLTLHNMAPLVERVFEGPKTHRMFARLKKLATANQSIFVVGDQLTRDIEPANQVEIPTIYIPGAFRPAWEIASEISPTVTVATFWSAALFILKAEREVRKNIERSAYHPKM